jgi:hypothetical protein
MRRPSNPIVPLALLAALLAVTGCQKRSVKVKPNEIPPTETNTPAPPPPGTEPTPGKVPPPTSPTTPTTTPNPGTSQAETRVRVLHAAQGVPSLDLYVRGQREAVVERLAPGMGTAYVPVPLARINVRATVSGTGAALLGPTNVEFAPGRDNTVVIAGRASEGTLRLRVHTDN